MVFSEVGSVDADESESGVPENVAELVDRDNLGWGKWRTIYDLSQFRPGTARRRALDRSIGMAATRGDGYVYLTCSRERERKRENIAVAAEITMI